MNQALIHDPQNFAAQIMKKMIEDSLFYIQIRDAKKRFNSPEAQQNRLVEAKLKEPVSIHFDNTPLVNAIDHLRTTTRMNFYVDWKALEKVGVKQDTPITMQPPYVSADAALKVILKLAATAGNGQPLDYTIDKGIVKISTAAQLQRIASFANRAIIAAPAQANTSEVDRQTLTKLNEPVPANFDNNSLTNVIDYLRNTTGVNIVVNWNALASVRC